MKLKKFLVKIVMPDGSIGRHQGIYTDGCAAVMIAMKLFPQAQNISAWRLP